MLTRTAMRLRQGIRALTAFAQPLDPDQAESVLSAELLRLFRQMKRGEQLHSLRVLRALLAEGEAGRDLMAAALLHDVGKARCPLAVWQKTLAVLVRAAAPRLFARLSAGDPRHPVCRPFVAALRHAEWGGEMVRAAGGSDALVWLVAHHQDAADRWRDHPCAPALRRLQSADDRN